MFRKAMHALLVLAFILPAIIPVSALAKAPNAHQNDHQDQPSVQVSATATPTPPNAMPLQAEVDPGLDLKNYSPFSAFVLNFNQPMDTASASIPLLAYPYLDGNTIWNSDKTSLTFTPASRLTPGETYTLFLDPNLKSMRGESFTETQYWELNVLLGPNVISRTPGLENLTTRRPAIAITFDRPMNAGSVAEALSLQPEVPYTLTWSNNMLRIALQEALTPGERYSFTLASSASDADGVPMADDYRWDYWVPNFEITVINPTLQDNRVRLNLNYAVTTGKDAPTFSISPEVSGAWKWTSTTQAEFQPAADLSYGTLYTITPNETMIDAQGDALPVTTNVLTFSAPPPISAIHPGGSDDVPIEEAEVRITFAVPMDHASTEAAFSISPHANGTFEWRENELVYILADKLASYTEYTVSIQPSAQDSDHQPILVDPYSWTFYTSWSPHYENETTSFGVYGPNVQVVDANGRRAVHLGIADGEQTLVFTVYEMELGAFAARYAADFAYNGWDSEATIDTSRLEATQSWQIAYPSSGAQEVILPPEIEPGLYILTLRVDDTEKDQLFLALTQNALVVKQSGSNLFVWASAVDGEAASEIEVRLYSSRGESIREGKTDQNGFYRTTIPAGYEPLFVAARGGEGDVSIAGLTTYAWRTSNGNYYVRGAEVPEYNIYTYTDRPIYRPGQTMYFKSILRSDRDVRFSVPPMGTPVTVRVRDGRENIVQTFKLTTNNLGTINGEFQIADGASLGNYSIEVTIGSTSQQQAFKVQEYRKPDIQVELTANADKYVIGDTVVITGNTSYFFGEPVPNAQITVVKYYLVENYSWGWWNEEVEIPDYTWYQYYGEEAQDLSTDAEGNFSYAFTAQELDEYNRRNSWRSSLQESLWGFEVTVDDGSGQTVSSAIIVRVYNAANKISLDPGGYFKSPGKSFTVSALAVTLDDAPVPDRLLTLEVTRWDWEDNTDTEIATYQMTTGADGKASQSITLGQSGYYKLNLTGQDERGNPIAYSTWCYAYQPGQSWASRYDTPISITAEADSYRPYDTGRFFIESTFSGPALVTFERGSVISSKLVELTAPVTVIETEIIPEFAPNVFVVVNAWEPQDTRLVPGEYAWQWIETIPDSQLRQARTELQVEVIGKSLEITITPDQPVYAPRQDATFTIQVNDEQGNPVRAELSLALIDEAIFSLSGDLSGPIFSAFYGRREHHVITYDSFSPTRWLQYGEGGLGGGGGDIAGNPRSEFPDTAAWFPVITTDANGQASITVALPDNLTSWRVVVKAITANTQVNEAYINILTQKEVVVRPILPAALTVGDQVELSALIHNYGLTAKDLIVEMDAGDALAIAQPDPITISLQPGEIQVVSWTVTALTAGDAEITISATTASGSGDAVRLPLTIHPLAVPDVYTQVGDFSGEYLTTLVMPPGALDMSSVQIRISRSAAGTLLDGLEYLTGYPYGCVEQTMSRALPNAVIGRALYQLGVSNPNLEAELPGLINAGLQMLYGMQHNDGGWGWWYDDETDDYQTAWVVFGLSVTAQAGYEVDPNVIERGANRLKENLEFMDPRTQAYALYSLSIAGYADLAATQALAAQYYTLDTFSQAALALALHTAGDDDTARQVLQELAQNAVVSEADTGTLVYWPQPNEDGHYHQKTMSSTIRSTALALDAFAQLDPENILVPGIVRYLMGQRQASGWGSTNETSFTIIALTDHLLSLQNDNAETEYRIELNGTEIGAGSLGRTQPSITLELQTTQLQTGASLLHITTEDEGRLYYAIVNRIYLPQAEIDAAGFVEVERTYTTADSSAQEIQIGQLVQVTLEVTFKKDASFIIIEDQLPGGLEALNESLNTTSHIATSSDCWDSCQPVYNWETFGYNNKEIYPDHVSFFITNVSAGTITISYLARATHSGTFVVLPAEVYAMYDSSTWGRSASTPMMILPK